MPRRTHPAAIGFLALAVLIVAAGVWAQLQQNDLAVARAEAVAAYGAAAAATVPVPFILLPFEQGLVPDFLLGASGQSTVFGVMTKIGGTFGLLGLLFLSLRGRSPVEAEAEEQAEEEIYTPYEVPAVASKNDWQQRLAAKMREEPAPKQKPKPKSGIGRSLHRAAIVLVGLAFVGLTAVTIMGSGADFASANLDSINMGGIDIPSLRAQIMSTIQAAMDGDQSAMIMVGQVAAVVLGFLIVLKVLFFRRKPVKRRDFATMS